MARGFDERKKDYKDNMDELNTLIEKISKLNRSQNSLFKKQCAAFDPAHEMILALLGFAIQENNKDLLYLIENNYIRLQFEVEDTFDCLEEYVELGKKRYEKLYKELLEEEETYYRVMSKIDF